MRPSPHWYMNKELRLQVRYAACTLCKMSNGAEQICITAQGPNNSDILVVYKHPAGVKYQHELEAFLKEAGLDLNRTMFTAAIKCKNYDAEPSKADIKTCRRYIEREIEVIQPKWILLLGNEALQSVLGKSGITKYRAQVFDLPGGSKVMATISMSAVHRQPGQLQSFKSDLQYFVAKVENRALGIPAPSVVVVDNKRKLKMLRDDLGRAYRVSYDVETVGFNEFASEAAIVSLAMTLRFSDTGKIRTYALPLFHPYSVWRKIWPKVLEYIAPAFERIPLQIAHNGKFDARWLRHFGIHARVTFDTLLASHLLDENRPKGLKVIGRTRLAVDPWDIETDDLLETDLNEVLEYNALDAYYTYHVYKQLRKELKVDKRLERLYRHITIPANTVYIEAERRGIWVDREKLATRAKIATETRDDIEAKLMEWVPDEIPQLGKSKKAQQVNFNPSNFLRWWLFDHLELPILARGKEKDDGSPGDPSCAEDVMLALKDEHPVVELLLERSKWQKYCSAFFPAYAEMLDENDRIHTTYKLWGTVTGRTSSGKPEKEKIVGNVTIRGVNLQQVPRDEFVRGVFGAPPGWTFVEADQSQIELRVAAFLSGDETMTRLYQLGEDIHRATAATVLGVAPSKIDSVMRKSAKAVNFGFLYGMGADKFIRTAFEKYGLQFTKTEAQAYRTAYFNQFRGLLPWHERQRRVVRKHKQVENPLGRVRRLPDIDSPDKKVRAEAERQAINSPVQSFANDLSLFAMVLIARKFRELKLPGYIIGSVHDSINFEIRNDALPEALPIIKDTMQNLPLEETFGIALTIPLVADLKVGSHWGTAKELTEEEVYNYAA